MPLLLLGIISIVFIVSRLTPADPLVTIVGERNLGNPEIVAAAKRAVGPRPEHPRAVRQVHEEPAAGRLGHVVHHPPAGAQRPVGPAAGDARARPSSALFIGVVGGVGLGVLAARKRNTVVDHVARFFALLGSSLPAFWAGLLFLYIFYARLGWLPGPGTPRPAGHPARRDHRLLHVDSLLHGDFSDVLGRVAPPDPAGVRARLGRHRASCRGSVRASLLDELSIGLRARGAGHGHPRAARSSTPHALRNALLPTITIVGFSFAFLITGAVLIETVFSWPGVGSYAVEASRERSTSRRSSGCRSSAASRSCSPTWSPTSPTPSPTRGSGCRDRASRSPSR